MGLGSTIKGWLGMFLGKEAKEEFKVSDITSEDMKIVINRCEMTYKGYPAWVSAEDRIKTINFAKTMCSETARLTTLAIGVQFDAGVRGSWLQTIFNRSMYFRMRHWIEYGNAYGTIILKPTGVGIDAFVPGQFIVTSTNGNGEIDGVIFKDEYQEGDHYYTRLEYQRFENELYVISNKAFRSKKKGEKGKPIALKETKWSDLTEEVYAENIERPLFGVYRTPEANNVDMQSPLGMPLVKEASEELKDVDIAYSRYVEEIFDSSRTVLADERLLMGSGENLKKPGRKPKIRLPRIVKNVFGGAEKEFYQEINPQLNTEQRIAAINHLLDMAAVKMGYSPGYFRFDGKTGLITATQVESDDRRTIQLIKDHRDKLEDCLDGLIYALNKFADLYDLAPAAECEVSYSFGDITYNYEEDKATWWKYRQQGDIPPWLYYEKFEGMTKDEAKKMVEEAQVKAPKLYEDEE